MVILAQYYIAWLISLYISIQFQFLETEIFEDSSQDLNLQKCEHVQKDNEENDNQDDAAVGQDDRLSQVVPLSNVEGRGANNNFTTWITSIFILPKQLVLERGGIDALYYLRFQRHIIAFLFIVTIISIGVILPINLQGTLTHIVCIICFVYRQKTFNSYSSS